MALSANQILSTRAPANHGATSKHQFDISSQVQSLNGDEKDFNLNQIHA